MSVLKSWDTLFFIHTSEYEILTYEYDFVFQQNRDFVYIWHTEAQTKWLLFADNIFKFIFLNEIVVFSNLTLTKICSKGPD